MTSARASERERERENEPCKELKPITEHSNINWMHTCIYTSNEIFARVVGEPKNSIVTGHNEESWLPNRVWVRTLFPQLASSHYTTRFYTACSCNPLHDISDLCGGRISRNEGEIVKEVRVIISLWSTNNRERFRVYATSKKDHYGNKSLRITSSSSWLCLSIISNSG